MTTTVAHCGTYSAQLTPTQTYHALQYTLPVATGDGGTGIGPGSYTFSGWVYHDNAIPIQFAVQGVCNNNNYINVAFPTVAPATWAQATGTLVIPADCTSLYVQVKENYPTPVDGAVVPLPHLYRADVYLVQ